MTRSEIERMVRLEERNAELARENAELRKKQNGFTNGSTSNLNSVEAFFMNLVKNGKLQQMPANYDCATLKMYISHLENENVELKAKIEKAVELPCKVGDTIYTNLFGNVSKKWKIISIHIAENDISFTADCNGYWKFNIKDYDKTWFTEQNKNR